jgi:hypothetical protein
MTTIDLPHTRLHDTKSSHLLNEWPADDVHGESLAVIQVCDRVFEAARSGVVACERDER